MERDPSRFVWRSAPGLNAAAVLLALLLGVPLLWLTLDLVRASLDLPRDASDGSVTLFRVAIPLPERIRASPLVLVPGVSVAASAVPAVTAAGFLMLVAVAGTLWWALRSLARAIGRRALARLASDIVDGIASAPASAREDARAAALVSVDAFASDRAAFGSLAILPWLVGIALVASLAVMATGEITSVLALLVGLCLTAFAASRGIDPRTRRLAAERAASMALGRALTGVADNLSAIARHGTRGSERSRIGGELSRIGGLAAEAGAETDRMAGLTVAAAFLGPAGAVAAGLWAGARPGEVAVLGLAAAAGAGALRAHLVWRNRIADARPAFAEMARMLGGFQSRRRTNSQDALPAGGVLAAEGLATAPYPTGRLAGIDLSVALPDQVALCGAPDAGARTFAAVLGGEVAPTRGRVTLAGRDLLGADDADRARRLAYAGGETYLFAGSLRANLLYGAPDVPEQDAPLAASLAVAGLEGLVERRGLSGTVDPRRDPRLADAIVTARRAVRDAIAARGLSDLVEPFDAAAYNQEATVGENLLFGVPVGDTFRPDRLPSQPFVTALLDREGLAKPLAEMGATIARNMIDIFAELPEEDSLIARFALVASAGRDVYEGILERRGVGRRGAAAGRDAERLVGLALRYNERRHRMGLLGPELQERLVRLRSTFAASIPKSLEPAIEFFHPDKLTAAASVEDNLLFGRVAHDRANAERTVAAVIHEVLAKERLAPELARVGLGTRVDPVDPDMSAAELAGIELVRCLMRQPDTLVVEHALDHLPGVDAVALARRLVAAQDGRGLLLCVPYGLEAEIVPMLARAVTFMAGQILPESAGPAGESRLKTAVG